MSEPFRRVKPATVVEIITGPQKDDVAVIDVRDEVRSS